MVDSYLSPKMAFCLTLDLVSDKISLTDDDGDDHGDGQQLNDISSADTVKQLKAGKTLIMKILEIPHELIWGPPRIACNQFDCQNFKIGCGSSASIFTLSLSLSLLKFF